jgi:hypothetical protein
MTSTIASKKTELTGPELESRLDQVGWSLADFARFTGIRGSTAYEKKAGRISVTMYDQRILEYIESDPVRLLALPEMQTAVRQSRSRRMAVYAEQRATQGRNERELERHDRHA